MEYQEINKENGIFVLGVKITIGHILMTGYLISLAVAETLLFNLSAVLGVIVYFLILLVLIFSATVSKEEANRKLWIALGLVPLIRIVSTVMPIPEFAETIWYILIGVPVFIGIFTMSRYLKYSPDDFGLNTNALLRQLIIAVTGFGFGLIDYIILKPEPLMEFSFAYLIFPGLILLIFTGFMEELAFRGVMQRSAEALGRWGWVFIALTYTVLQIGTGSVVHLAFTFGVSLIFGFMVKKTGSLVGVSASHGILNILLFLVLPTIVI